MLVQQPILFSEVSVLREKNDTFDVCIMIPYIMKRY
jgi:hypothetical protein